MENGVGRTQTADFGALEVLFSPDRAKKEPPKNYDAGECRRENAAWGLEAGTVVPMLQPLPLRGNITNRALGIGQLAARAAAADIPEPQRAWAGAFDA
jgi:hypothetical protein